MQYVDCVSLTSAIIPFKVSLRFSPRSVRDQGFLNTRVMSWMTLRVKLSDDVDHAYMMSRMMSQQILSDDIVSRFSIKSWVHEMWLQLDMFEKRLFVSAHTDNLLSRIQWRKSYDVINIRNIKPYYQWIVHTLIMAVEGKVPFMIESVKVLCGLSLLMIYLRSEMRKMPLLIFIFPVVSDPFALMSFITLYRGQLIGV